MRAITGKLRCAEIAESGMEWRLGLGFGYRVFAFPHHRREKLRFIRVLIHFHMTFRRYELDIHQKWALPLDSNVVESWSGYGSLELVR